MYLGYPHSSGASFIDYWLTDPYAHAEDDRMHTERFLRLPESFLCFGSFEDRPRAALPPAAHKRYVTFASFNNLAKLSPTTVGLWARILQRVPRSRLLMKNGSLKNGRARANVEAAFQAHGIDRDRLELRGPVADRAEHLDQYARDVDIALDPMPYNGTTTTAEALWMGVPVVTLVGRSHRQRVSYSMLRNIGVEDTIAHDQDQYVAIAADLACDLAALERLRSRVAVAVRQSVLCDPARFTQQLDDVLWRVGRGTLRAPA
jgi:predicted O-linked N-acetylglucosamine transferase (SPINDLY family)